jgi:hypothetical protein
MYWSCTLISICAKISLQVFFVFPLHLCLCMCLWERSCEGMSAFVFSSNSSFFVNLRKSPGEIIRQSCGTLQVQTPWLSCFDVELGNLCRVIVWEFAAVELEFWHTTSTLSWTYCGMPCFSVVHLSLGPPADPSSSFSISMHTSNWTYLYFW